MKPADAQAAADAAKAANETASKPSWIRWRARSDCNPREYPLAKPKAAGRRCRGARSAARGPGIHGRHDRAALCRARRPHGRRARAGRRRRRCQPAERRQVQPAGDGDHERPFRSGEVSCWITAPIRISPPATGLTALYATIDVQWAPKAWFPQPNIEQEKIGYLDLMKALLEHGANRQRAGRREALVPLLHQRLHLGRSGRRDAVLARRAIERRRRHEAAGGARRRSEDSPTKAGDTPLHGRRRNRLGCQLERERARSRWSTP